MYRDRMSCEGAFRLKAVLQRLPIHELRERGFFLRKVDRHEELLVAADLADDRLRAAIDLRLVAADRVPTIVTLGHRRAEAGAIVKLARGRRGAGERELSGDAGLGRGAGCGREFFD